MIRYPEARVVHSVEGYTRTRVNSLGLFDTESEEWTLPRRAVLLGVSYAEAIQVSRAASFAGVTESLISGMEIINTGQSGRSPAHSVAYLEDFADLLHPDLIVLQVNDGDVEDLHRMSGDGTRPADASALPENPAVAALKTLMDRSGLVTFLVRRMNELRAKETRRLSAKFSPRAPAGTPGPRTVPDDVEAKLDHLVERMRRVAPRVVVVYIPHVEYFEGTPRVSYPERREFYRRFCAERDIVLVDPTQAFLDEYHRSRQPAHGFANSTIGSGHINALGHHLVGTRLARVLDSHP